MREWAVGLELLEELRGEGVMCVAAVGGGSWVLEGEEKLSAWWGLQLKGTESKEREFVRRPRRGHHWIGDGG